MKIAVSATQPNIEADVDERFGRAKSFMTVKAN
jgi:predicted Fe-Mo cluster-binding NifX family protein